MPIIEENFDFSEDVIQKVPLAPFLHRDNTNKASLALRLHGKKKRTSDKHIESPLLRIYGNSLP